MVGRNNKKQIMISSADSIKKSNELSTAKLNQGLTLNQMQLLSYAIYATQQDGSTTFIKANFEKKFNIEKYQTQHAKEDAQRLVDIKFSIEDLENDHFEYWNVFQSIKYREGTFIFKWNDEMVPHILDLKEKYVLTDLTITANFKSGFSWTLYDYLRGFYGCWYLSLTKEVLMKLFGVEKKLSYQTNTGLLKKYVLDVAITEINKFTELDVKYEEIKQGRAIVGFKLIWSTGKGIAKASKKQMDILNSMADVVFEDALIYADIKDEGHRERALQIVRDFQYIKHHYLRSEVGLTAEKASELTRSASADLDILNYLLEAEGMPKLDIAKDVPLFNWLDGKI
ncbi:MAG: replication initiation protein [Alkalibacterium sp.]|nr:replication initiation protein [Atopostipes suicloacalis]MDN6730040.1 replication initiation protein [Alkalibacterium sp.]